MSVSVQQQGSKWRIAVLGRALDDDCAALADALALPAHADVELTFYDAEQLPRAMILLLGQRLDQGADLKIVAYHVLLARSLLRLKLPVRQVTPRAPQPAATPCRALALAGSAGSLDKILHLISCLPLADVAVFVVQHIDENQENLLDQLLKSRTEYLVLMPQQLTPIRPGTLYIAPPGHHMKVAHGLVYLTRDRKIQYSRPSIDLLFESLAGEYGPAALAILLCGFGQDGTQGCAMLRAAGATVLAEDGDDCAEARVMPEAASTAGHVDLVLPLAGLASVMAATVAGIKAPPRGTLLALFLEALQQHYGLDFRQYQQASLERRMQLQMTQGGYTSFAAFQRAVLSDTGRLERLVAELPVGVTAFFRHPEQFRQLRQDVLPYLASFPLLKLWSAGCASGEEAYSLAILLQELGLLERSHLFATDINPHMLEQARSGLFPAEALELNRHQYLASGGPASFDDYVAPGRHFLDIAPPLRQKVLFHRHSLTADGSFNEFQLIVCRNVLIYFDAELQRQVLQCFARSLHVDGFLVLGPQDGLNLAAREQGFVPHGSGNCVYRRAEGCHA
ncbi:hypothetical protein GTP58_21535 [Duganella sp. CY15W]|uniref:chemotaxis protein CheB n=1 Tax=Duganella sp. CY15W TaxID=2692172 RepID=UPI00136F8282|nr:chemotaxis protein CheB [Duganella sp. CY15W]MYM30923.1 hypothetical protein [Duganella sp. CY15W]